jgi:hypothetical protein
MPPTPPPDRVTSAAAVAVNGAIAVLSLISFALAI